MIYVLPSENPDSLDLSDALIIALLAEDGLTVTPADCAEVRQLSAQEAALRFTDWDSHEAIYRKLHARRELGCIDYLLSFGFGAMDAETGRYLRAHGEDVACGSTREPALIRGLLKAQGVELSETTLAAIPCIKWG